MMRDMTNLRCQVVRWVSSDPQPGWVETQFRGADGEVWQMFDKPSIFQGPDGPELIASTRCPVEIEMLVTVHATKDSEFGPVAVAMAVVSRPWGLDYEFAQDTSRS